MVKLHGPLFSMLASGLLKTGLQISSQPKGTHLTRSHTPTTTYTRAQLSLRSFVRMLAQFWAEWHTVIGAEWANHPRAKRTSPYHAMLWENHRRRLANLWPIAVWGVPPSGPAPVPGGKTFTGSARTISVQMLSMSGNKAIFCAGFTLPYTYGLVRPLNVMGWGVMPTSSYRPQSITHLAAGTYSVQWFFIDGFGQISTPCGGVGIVVQP
jgi:hypothetical protein